MAKVVNLNRYRKKRDKEAADKVAAENRVRFGQGKSERRKNRSEAAKAAKKLEDKRLD
jgi:hypothetical protein